MSISTEKVSPHPEAVGVDSKDTVGASFGKNNHNRSEQPQTNIQPTVQEHSKESQKGSNQQLTKSKVKSSTQRKGKELHGEQGRDEEFLNQANRGQKQLNKVENPQNNSKMVEKIRQKREKLPRKNKNQSLNDAVLSPQKKKESQKMINADELEKKIKEIANSIKRKVDMEPKQVTRYLPILHEGKKNRSKKESVLSPISPKIESAFLTGPESSDLQVNAHSPKHSRNYMMMKSLIREHVIKAVERNIQTKEMLSRVKLKLDPIKHKYPISSFGKQTLREAKTREQAKAAKAKQKEQKLFQRRQIFNNSRYQRYVKSFSPKRSFVGSAVYETPLEANILLLNKEGQSSQQLKKENLFEASKENRDEVEKEEEQKEEKSVKRVSAGNIIAKEDEDTGLKIHQQPSNDDDFIDPVSHDCFQEMAKESRQQFIPQANVLTDSSHGQSENSDSDLDL